MTKMTVNQFIKNLSGVAENEALTNQYKNPVIANNLAVYLSYMEKNPPKCLFVGEAAGHLGCALSGIPFTDEYRLTPAGKSGCLPLLSPKYAIISDESHRENSATLIWNVFSELSFFPVLWNIVPFHPHNVNDRSSNRTPTPSEIGKYSRFVEDILVLFPSINRENGIFAIGRKSEAGLLDMGINASYIRHPSHGGSTKCREHIIKIANFSKK
ncbi:MAG: uracil-DNA glycosylase [Lentimicrobiaceae bacterium]|nr:uracil-DNA glycosylase [Lentimicrobiaceae bacterium]